MFKLVNEEKQEDIKIKKMEDENNIIFFDNDNDFYEFCVEPKVFPAKDEHLQDLGYIDFNLSAAYQDAVTAGKSFMIKDINSQIYKKGCVSYRTISKPIKNLKKYSAKYRNAKNNEISL